MPQWDNQTLVSLRDHFEEKLQAQRDYFVAQIEAQEKAAAVALVALERRLDALNELRGTLRDQNALMATRVELEAAKENIEKDLRLMREFMNTMKGKASQSEVSQALVISFVSLGIGVVAIILRILGS